MPRLHKGNASNCRGDLMVVERTITVGFHSNFGAFKRNRHSKTVTRLAITNEFPFNPTYESQNSVTNLARFSIL